jgi:hypothetical protein
MKSLDYRKYSGKLFGPKLVISENSVSKKFARRGPCKFMMMVKAACNRKETRTSAENVIESEER